MNQPLANSYLFSIALLLSVIACSPNSPQETLTKASQETTKPTEQAVQTTLIVPSSTILSTKQLSSFFDSDEAAAIQQIKQVFDKGLRGSSKDRTLTYLYKDHAQRMRMDFFNKYPFTLNYPFNGKFDLSLVSKDIPPLSFLTNKCGFQKEGSDEVIHYYCLKDKGNFIDFMEYLGKENTLIDNLRKNYISQKSISKEVRQWLVMSSDELDFEQPEHQLVYMFYQILINEERLAADKV